MSRRHGIFTENFTIFFKCRKKLTPELNFCTGSNPAHVVSKFWDCENL